LEREGKEKPDLTKTAGKAEQGQREYIDYMWHEDCACRDGISGKFYMTKHCILERKRQVE
jgi:hypothetical protein